MTSRVILINFIILLLSLFFNEEAKSEIPISTIQELQKIGNDPGYPLDGSYYLTNDIDASDTINWNDGKGFEPISFNDTEKFSGVFDGKNFNINYLHINRPENNMIGLFSDIDIATIKNISIHNCNIIGNNQCGALVGFARGPHIFNIICSGKIVGKSSGIGGIVGESGGYDIQYCSFSGEVKGKSSVGGIIGFNGSILKFCNSSAVIYGEEDNIGGIAGINFLDVSNCYSVGLVYGGIGTGGLVGKLVYTIENSYSICFVTGDEPYAGGLWGTVVVYGEPRYEIIDCFYDCEVSGQPCGGLSGKTTADMMDPATFENWDFENVWWIVPGKTYPLLRPERYIDVSLKPADWMPEPKYGFPLEYEIAFGEEMSDRFTFDDIDFTSSTLESPVGTLTTENGTTWTLMITDTASTPTWPADLVIRVPIAGATNLANYPCAESNATSITIQAPAIPGDFNGDGVCDETDKIILVEMIIEPASPWKTRIPFTRRDLNADNIIDVADVVAILPLMNKSQ